MESRQNSTNLEQERLERPVPVALLSPMKLSKMSEDSLCLLGILGFMALIYAFSPFEVMVYPRALDGSWGILEGKNTPYSLLIKKAQSSNIDPGHLLAISAQESSLGKHLIGDGGKSKGWFQINTAVYPVAFIGDVGKEADWVISKLKEYGYDKNPRLAIAMYNRPARPNFAYADLVLGPRLTEVRELLK